MASIARVFDPPHAEPTPVLELPRKSLPPAANRRFVPRVARSFRVRPHDGGAVMQGIDISFGGLMCATDDPVWPGNCIDFDIVLPDETEPIAASGRVVELVSHRGHIAMRVRFDAMPMAARKRIAAWMAHAYPSLR